MLHGKKFVFIFLLNMNMLLEAYYDRNPKLVNLMKKVKGAFVQTKRRIDSNRNGNRYILSRLEVKITVYLPI